jgi:hypothetical protein
MSDSKMSETN